jgi:hypothetical protein
LQPEVFVVIAGFWLCFFLDRGSLDFTTPSRRRTVDEKVEVEATDAVSVSLTGLEDIAGLYFGDAGWKRVGGRSFGKPTRHKR